MKYYKYRKSKPLTFFIPYHYHIEKFCETSCYWFEIGRYTCYKEAKIEFERLKEVYSSLHFRLIFTLELF